MDKKIGLTYVLGLVGALSAYAGEMGPAMVQPFGFKPFLVGEAGYSWPQTKGISIVAQNVGLIKDNIETQGWGGRLAFGLMHQMTEKFAGTGEVGWAYHDHVTISPVVYTKNMQITPDSSVYSSNFDQYGVDLLVGLMYTRPKYDAFLKVGALFENMRYRIGLNMNDLLRYNNRQADFQPGAMQSLNSNAPQVMPEIKIGGNYHINEHWSMTASWMHAFGGAMGVFSNQLDFASNQVKIGNISLNINNPTLNTVYFGVEYRFG